MIRPYEDYDSYLGAKNPIRKDNRPYLIKYDYQQKIHLVLEFSPIGLEKLNYQTTIQYFRASNKRSDNPIYKTFNISILCSLASLIFEKRNLAFLMVLCGKAFFKVLFREAFFKAFFKGPYMEKSILGSFLQGPYLERPFLGSFLQGSYLERPFIRPTLRFFKEMPFFCVLLRKAFLRSFLDLLILFGKAICKVLFRKDLLSYMYGKTLYGMAIFRFLFAPFCN
ncbi:hypothetical protein BpHYR1_034723 [Brachionus plicatilis]|uniref:Uncharacterized protein n=1 Tax=Brachionus plicatilis TaxID=10195 RepID=A0A3M7QBK8_BRAPC|nr:hypothetical protein BpHYR1_034723 [Brachionus plicatilis]